MSVRIRNSAALASLSLTPLIDVVFLLLIFFLAASRFAEEDRELDVWLPRASEAKPLVVRPKELLITVDQNGQYSLSGRPATLADVEAALRQAVADNPLQQTVMIRADRRTPFQFVVSVMNVCHRAGVSGYKVMAAEG